MVKSVQICTAGECGGECYRCRLQLIQDERDQALHFAFTSAEREYTAGHWGPWQDNFEENYGWLWNHPDAPWNEEARAGRGIR